LLRAGLPWRVSNSTPEQQLLIESTARLSALADVLHDTLGGAGTQTGTSWIVLAVWAIVTPLLAARLFRWD
jgi:hypothetical protein